MLQTNIKSGDLAGVLTVADFMSMKLASSDRRRLQTGGGSRRVYHRRLSTQQTPAAHRTEMLATLSAAFDGR